jgi:UMF1 family MFS transporter
VTVSTATRRTPAPRGQVAAWALWDWAGSAYHVVILTFVFSVYVTGTVGAGLCGHLADGEECTRATSWFGWAMGIAGACIAVFAPVTGQRADAGGHRKRSLGVFTGLTVVTCAGLFFVKPDASYFALGLVLMGIGAVVIAFAEVSYHAMLRQVSTPENIGRISGIGWSMGYFGGIVLLLVAYFGFVSDSAIFGVSTDNALNIRVIAVFAAAWLLVFAVPLLVKVPEVPVAASERRGFFASYKALIRDIAALYRTDRHTVFFLVASALFRDGLAGVFTFGAILANKVYGFSAGEVLIFGVAANVVAALGAVTAGRFDDIVGPKAVIVTALTGMIVSGTVVLFLSGQLAFWVCGLILCLFVGPAQSSSRTFLARSCPPGREGQMFGLYATTGRAVSFLAPTLFGASVAIFSANRTGIVGILAVLAIGLIALLPVRHPVDTLTRATVRRGVPETDGPGRDLPEGAARQGGVPGAGARETDAQQT